MYPHERSLVERLRDKPFAILGVNSDRDRERLKEVLQDEEITWRSWWNGGGTSGPISDAWQVRGWPTIYLIDHRGVIRFKNLRGDALDAAIDTLVARAEQDPGEAAADEEPPAPQPPGDEPQEADPADDGQPLDEEPPAPNRKPESPAQQETDKPSDESGALDEVPPAPKPAAS